MNNFPAMTEERLQDLIEASRDTIKYAADYPESEVLTAQIVLAALTAKSIAWIETGTEGFQRGSRLINYFTSDIQGFDNGTLIYAAPPAPVLKPIELASDMKSNPRAHETMQAYRDGWNDRGKADVDMLLSAGYEVKQ